MSTLGPGRFLIHQSAPLDTNQLRPAAPSSPTAKRSPQDLPLQIRLAGALVGESSSNLSMAEPFDARLGTSRAVLGNIG